MDEEVNILSFADFQERFPNVGLDFLTYHGLVSSVMTCQKKKREIFFIYFLFFSGITALPLDSDSKPWSVILKRGSTGCIQFQMNIVKRPKVCANGISFLLS